MWKKTEKTAKEEIVVYSDLLLRRKTFCLIDFDPIHSNIHFTIEINTFKVTQAKDYMYIFQTHHQV